MIRLAILDDYQHVALKLADWSPLSGRCEIEVFDVNLKVPDEAAERLRPFQIVSMLRERMAFPRSLFEKLPNLKFAAITGAFHRTMDMAAATDHGVLVSHTSSGGQDYATSELAWALILASVRHVAQEDRSMRGGGWQTTVGMSLHGKVLGLLGLGRIGRQMARIGLAFGMTVIAWSPNLTEEKAAAVGVRRVEKDELFRQSDVISIHMVLSERSQGIVGAGDLALMKPAAHLINTSRGPLVDEAALLAALRERRIGGAGLDVYDQEPLPGGHPFRTLDNAVITPHLGYVAEDRLRYFYQDTVENIAAYLDGKPIRLLNPEAAGRKA